MRTLLFSLLTFISLTAAAQDSSALQRWDANAILFDGYRFERANVPLRYRDLRSSLIQVPSAALLYASHRRSLRTVRILGAGSLALIAGGALVLDRNRDLGAGLMLGGAALNLVSIPVTIRTTRRLHAAVRAFNRNLLR